MEDRTLTPRAFTDPFRKTPEKAIATRSVQLQATRFGR